MRIAALYEKEGEVEVEVEDEQKPKKEPFLSQTLAMTPAWE